MGLGGWGDSTLVIKSVLEHLTRKKKDLCTVITIILGYMLEITQNQLLTHATCSTLNFRAPKCAFLLISPTHLMASTSTQVTVPGP